MTDPSILIKTVTKTCEFMHLQYVYTGDSVSIEFENYTSLIIETINSRGLADFSLIFIDIPQDRILEACKLMNSLNEDLEFGRFTFLVDQNKINYYLTSFIPEGVGEDQCCAIIREMIELTLTFILNATESIRLLSETQLSAEDIHAKFIARINHD
ncbi:MAG TPA: YbjN domain-containing protein [Methanocorpusculum sp.]|nr:YbjN domain-containing protein [Methanocorpusculum sp.]